ncbi:MAG: hypothetical protein JO310_02910 [Hyphomicrobiales bacterium]|nr:hypothetical protein [Hyphomicrobiales bacterium]
MMASCLRREPKATRITRRAYRSEWPEGCAYYPIDDAAPNEHRLERECAAALSSVTGWPRSPEECDYDYNQHLFLGPERVPNPRFLLLRPGKFLIEMDCGAGAYNLL